MSDYDIRALEPDEYRNSDDVFGAALHLAPITDEHWPSVVGAYEPGRTLGAFQDGELVGTTQSFASKLALPGGAVLPMAMVSRVGVRADHTRRGVLTSLQRAQLSGLAEPFASLRASEAVIYGRFGYGVATRGRTVVLNRARAITHPTAPTDGRVRLVPSNELLPAIYDRVGPGRAGWLVRPESWWIGQGLFSGGRSLSHAIHRGPDGDDGFARYAVERVSGHQPHPRKILHVHDLRAATPGAWADLWHFLLTVDLVDEVHAKLRPVDEPLEQLLTDHRAVHTTNVEDETWLRIVDVPAALAARSFGELSGDNAGSIVIEVRDPLLPTNSGHYRIGDGPARQVTDPAELAMDAATLSTLFLGDVSPSTLAMAGRLTTIKADALAVADRLFAVPTFPWCGTYF